MTSFIALYDLFINNWAIQNGCFRTDCVNSVQTGDRQKYKRKIQV